MGKRGPKPGYSGRPAVEARTGTRGPKKGHGGRPPVPVDVDTVKRAASIGCTNAEIAALTGVSERTYNNRFEKDEAFQEAVEIARGVGRATLRRYQWHAASNGNPAILIWLGKQMLGQVDRRELAGPDGGALELIVTGVRRAPEIEGQAEEMPPEAMDIGTGVQRAIEAGDGDD
jgi:hypothetical protein